MNDTTAMSRVCAFCGQQGDQDTRYAAGFGVLIDEDCIRFFDSALKDGAAGDAPMRRHDVDDLSDQELLDTLPRISIAAGQVNRFMAQWVDTIRSRKMSWTTVGNAMGISRQAAWERFTRVLGTDKSPGPR